MLYGFTYNGQHSSDIGLIMRSRNRALLPVARDTFKEIPGREGSYLFPGTFQDRFIQLDCWLREASLIALKVKARQIAAWLHTADWAPLTFDDEPDKYYRAKIADQVDLTQIAGLGRFAVSFRCLPLAYGTEVTEIFVNDLVVVNNLGTCEALPVFTVTFTDTAAEWKVQQGSRYIRVVRAFTAGDILTVNCETGAVLVNGVRALANLDWQNSKFFTLTPGVSGLQITPALVCTATVTITPRWL